MFRIIYLEFINIEEMRIKRRILVIFKDILGG